MQCVDARPKSHSSFGLFFVMLSALTVWQNSTVTQPPSLSASCADQVINGMENQGFTITQFLVLTKGYGRSHASEGYFENTLMDNTSG